MQIYIDEDALDGDVVKAFRSRGVTTFTALEESMLAKSDEEQLAFATEREWVLYTCNVGDFYRLHKEWIAFGREHAGMILVEQQRFSIGEQFRRV